MTNVTLNRRFLLICLAALVGMVAISGWASLQIPAGTEVPTHFGADGQPDAYGSKFEGLWLMPIISVAVLALMLAIPYFEPRRENLLRSSKAYGAFTVALMLFLLILHGSLVLIILGYSINLNLVLGLTLGALFVVIGNYLGKIRSTRFFGIRTPWTLNSDLSWNKTHRLGGKLFVLSGWLIMVAGLIAPNWLFVVLPVSIIGTTLLSVAYSYVIWKGDLTAHA